MTAFIDTTAMRKTNWIFATHPHLYSYNPIKLTTGIEPPEPASLNAPEQAKSVETSLELRLFDNAAALKMDMSKIAMHLGPEWRDFVRAQIDGLLSVDHWEDDESSLIASASFATFLRFVTHARPQALPGLGVSPRGHVLASWHRGDKRVMVEFLGDEFAKAGIVKPTDRHTTEEPDQEILSWHGRVANLLQFIRRNEALDCLA